MIQSHLMGVEALDSTTQREPPQPCQAKASRECSCPGKGQTWLLKHQGHQLAVVPGFWYIHK